MAIRTPTTHSSTWDPAFAYWITRWKCARWATTACCSITLVFSNFGYGGDPNDVSRLRIQKNKYYDFRVLFRRDKNFWDWNLLANPLNPITTNAAVSPTTPITNSPHALDLVRRMQDYDLTLFPEFESAMAVGLFAQP